MPALRGEAFNEPGGVGLASVLEAVVEAVGSALPEFDGIRRDAEAAPVRGYGNFSFAEA